MIVEFREVLEHNKRYSIHMRAKFSRIQCNFTLHLSTGCFIRKNRAEVGGVGNHHKQTTNRTLSGLCTRKWTSIWPDSQGAPHIL